MKKTVRLNKLLEGRESVKGRWAFGKHHEVEYRADGGDEEVRLKAAIVDVEPGALILSFIENRSLRRTTARILKLTGRWQVNPANQITFEVERQNADYDVLTFRGRWQAGKSQELVYSYRQTALKTKTKVLKTLVFKGYWDLSEENRLTYLIGGDSESSLRFRGALQTKSILAKDGRIRYQAGVELAGCNRVQEIILFGKWKVSRQFALSFEMEYGAGQKRAIRFGGEWNLDERNQLRIQLMTTGGEPIGAELVFTREFMKGEGGLFLRLAKSLEDSRLEAGVRMPW